MKQSQIIVDPLALLEMTAYHTKHALLEKATFGLLYAQQIGLKQKISLSAPLSTNKVQPKELVERSIEYQAIRLKKSKSTVNFYEQYTLFGVYLMKNGSERQAKFEPILQKISKQLTKRGAPYLLIVDYQGAQNPKLFLNDKEISYTTEIQKNQKLCIDSVKTQNVTSLNNLKNSISRQAESVQIFNQKMIELQKISKSKNLNPQKKRQIQELLNNYEKILAFNVGKKKKTIEAMNYSLLSGIVIDRLVKN